MRQNKPHSKRLRVQLLCTVWTYNSDTYEYCARTPSRPLASSGPEGRLDSSAGPDSQCVSLRDHTFTRCTSQAALPSPPGGQGQGFDAEDVELLCAMGFGAPAVSPSTMRPFAPPLLSSSSSCTHTHTQMRTRARARARTRKYAHAHAHAQAHAHASSRMSAVCHLSRPPPRRPRAPPIPCHARQVHAALEACAAQQLTRDGRRNAAAEWLLTHGSA